MPARAPSEQNLEQARGPSAGKRTRLRGASGLGRAAVASAGPARPGQERCSGLSLRVREREGSGGGRGGVPDLSWAGRSAGVAGSLSGQTSGGAQGLRGSGAQGRERRPGEGGALSERRAAGAGSRLPLPAGISSRLHAATRVGLGSAGEKQRPGRAGEGGGKARGGGAGRGWAGLGEAGVAPDLGAPGMQGGVLVERERPLTLSSF